MICHMMLNDLDRWVNDAAQPGDVAYLIDKFLDKRYLYFYKGPDDDPYSKIIDEQFFDYYINKLKVEETKMEKRCDNCKHFKNVPGSFSWCSHKEHAGALVPTFTACAGHETKEERTGPFDNLRFFIKDANTGELELKYACEDCGKVMDEPFHWWKVETPRPTKAFGKPGYHWRCEECDKKKEGKI